MVTAQRESASAFLKSALWESRQILDQITFEDLNVTNKLLDRMHDILWSDMESEYDAENFCQYLRQSGLSFTLEFQEFEQIWRRDELNHYIGFRQLYSLLYQNSVEEIDREMAARQPDFGPMQEFLRDEFSICVIVAYDEIATTRSYCQDFWLYKSFGSKPIANWIKYVTKDEGLHYHNALELISQRHRDRLSELASLVERLIEFNLEENHQYKSTFLFNHEQNEYFTPDFLRKCGDLICQRFGL